MKQLTQTLEDSCWQTCVAMWLECSPDLLPDQHSLNKGAEYANVLRAYLYKHHDLLYAEFGPEKFAERVTSRTPYIMMGETIRTSPDHDVWHAVIGVAGEQLWDVHPSRAGLTKLCKLGVIAPVHAAWRAEWQKLEVAGDVRTKCLCPACGEASAVS